MRRPRLTTRRHPGPATARVALLGIACLAPGCATSWSLRASRPADALRWPEAPAPAKLTYVEALTGLGSRRGAGAALKDAVVGTEPVDRGAFLLPVAVATGPDGRVAVADMGRGCVHLYLPSAARYERLLHPRGDRIASPVALAFDDASRLFVSDSTGRVLCYDAGGAPVADWAGPGTAGMLRPTGLAFSPRTKLLYVVDTAAHEVRAVDAAGGLAFTFGGRGVGEGQLNYPTHIFRSGAGELYVTDAMNFRIQVFAEASGAALHSFGHHGDGSGDLAMPKGIAVDQDGVVYVVDALFDNVQLFSRRGEFLLTLGGRGTGFGEFWLPSGAFISERGDLYVCDTYNGRVQVFRIAEGYSHGA